MGRAFVSKKNLSRLTGNKLHGNNEGYGILCSTRVPYALCKLPALQKLNLSRTVSAVFHRIEGNAASDGAMRGVYVGFSLALQITTSATVLVRQRSLSGCWAM